MLEAAENLQFDEGAILRDQMTNSRR